jgi:hypothetical protein
VLALGFERHVDAGRNMRTDSFFFADRFDVHPVLPRVVGRLIVVRLGDAALVDVDRDRVRNVRRILLRRPDEPRVNVDLIRIRERTERPNVTEG